MPARDILQHDNILINLRRNQVKISINATVEYTNLVNALENTRTNFHTSVKPEDGIKTIVLKTAPNIQLEIIEDLEKENIKVRE